MLSLAAIALLGNALGTVKAVPIEPLSDGADFNTTVARRDIRGSLPERASVLELKFQPVLDFDKDGCYSTSAIDEWGGTNPGLGSVLKCPASDCRNPDRLDHNNVYSRSRCNNGWCAFMYEYYFEKDQTVCGSFAGGHRHDWEHIIVFTDKNNKVVRAAPSCHGGHSGATNTPRLEGDSRVKMVYHKDGPSTHCFRSANEADDGIENHTGKWFSSKVVGWEGWPSVEMRNKVLDGRTWDDQPDGIRPKLGDEDFANNLRDAMGDAVPGFDPTRDE